MMQLRKETALIIVATLWTTVAEQPMENAMKMIKDDNVNDGFGSYSFEFELSDGTKRREMGRFVNDPSLKEPVFRVEGSYIYTGPDNFIYTVSYTADENGYHPVVEKEPTFTRFGGVGPGVVASLLG